MTDVPTPTELRAMMLPEAADVLNAVAEALQAHYGFIPLDVRYGAAEAAKAIVDEWYLAGQRDPKERPA